MFARALGSLLLTSLIGFTIAADQPAELTPKTFTFETQGAALGTVLDELAKQTGAQIGRTKAENDRVLRLDCKRMPFWEALERIARESDHRISFTDQGRKVQLTGGGDNTYRESPVSFDRVFRISARRVQSIADLE